MRPTGRCPAALPAGADDDVLQVAILVDCVQRAVASEPGFLETAERQFNHWAGAAIDVDIAGDQPLGGVEYVVKIIRPDRGAETVAGAVGDPDRLVEIVEFQDGEYRSEDFLLRQRTARIGIN